MSVEPGWIYGLGRVIGFVWFTGSGCVGSITTGASWVMSVCQVESPDWVGSDLKSGILNYSNNCEMGWVTNVSCPSIAYYSEKDIYLHSIVRVYFSLWAVRCCNKSALCHCNIFPHTSQHNLSYVNM